MTNRKILTGTSGLAVMFASLAGVAGTAQARAADDQAQAAAADSASDGEILVTARHREEKLQDVPVAVIALSGNALAERAISTVSDLTKTTPGLNVTASARGASTPFIVLRGHG